MKILILEPHAHGHHGPYLEWIVSALMEWGLAVTVITLPSSMSHSCLRSLTRRAYEEREKRLHIIAPEGFIGPCERNVKAVGLVMQDIGYWCLFKKWYNRDAAKIQPDIVFLPYLDYCLYAIGLLGSPFGKTPWGGLAMRPSFHYRQMGVDAPTPSLATIKKILFHRLVNNRHLKFFLTIDETMVGYCKNNFREIEKVFFLPQLADFAALPSRADAKRLFGIPVDRKVILGYGAISARKGIPELLKALSDSAFPPSVDVLLAGEISQEILDILATEEITRLVAQGRLRIIGRFIETEEELSLFAASDIVWLGYNGHYTASGVLTQAARAGRPILACKEGLIGWQTKRHNLGKVLNPGDTAEVIAAVNDLLRPLPKDTVIAKSDDRSIMGCTRVELQNILVRAVTNTAPSSED